MNATGWRSVFGAGETQQRVRPREFKGDLLNPHIGTTTFQRFNGDALYPGNSWDDKEGPEKFSPPAGKLKNERYPDTTLSYCRWIWGRFEPQKGKFRWDIIDGALQSAAERGQRLQMRMQPYIGDDLPDWYWQTGAAAMDTTGTRQPNHNTDQYLRHWGDAVTAIGQRYDGHPALECFDVAYGGPCGEVGGDATYETAAKLVDIYAAAFKKTPLISMMGTEGCRYAAEKYPHFGWRGDCFGDLRANGRGNVPNHLAWNHTFDMYPREVVEFGCADAWRRGQVTLETCWTVGHWHEQKWDIDFILDQCLKFHPSVFMPKSCYYPEEWWEKMMAFNRRLGYRFVLRQLKMPLEAKPGQDIELDVWIDNVGIAPIYRPYQMAIRFSDGQRHEIVPLKVDVRGWMPENNWFKENVKVPASFRSGTTVDVAVGLIDGASGKPAVKLAIEGIGADGWHPMTHLDVV